MDPTRHGYPPDRAAVYYRTMMERLQGAAGFESLSIAALAPFGSGRTMQLQNPTGSDRAPIEVYANAVSRGYFDVLGMTIVQGRAFVDRVSRAIRSRRRPAGWVRRSSNTCGRETRC